MIDAGEAEVGHVGKTIRLVAIDGYAVDLLHDALLQTVAEFSHARRFNGHFLHRDLARRADADGAGDVDRPAAIAALVAAAVHVGGELDPLGLVADEQAAAALGSVKFVPRER